MSLKMLFIIFSAPYLLVVQNVSAGDINIDRLTKALIQKESKGDIYAVGDSHLRNKSYGPLQIRQPAVDDVNRHYGTRYRAEDCLGNTQLSLWIFEKYIQIYATERRLGHSPTTEDIARIWNGGPNGYRKVSTIPYWRKVQGYL